MERERGGGRGGEGEGEMYTPARFKGKIRGLLGCPLMVATQQKAAETLALLSNAGSTPSLPHKASF